MEVWRDIEGYVGLYQVSNKGRVRSLDRLDVRSDGSKGSNRRLRGALLKASVGKVGYYVVVLSKNRTRKTFTVHRLVAIAFIDNPDNKGSVNHINGIKTDNDINNLEWTTHKENMRHGWDTGLITPSYNNKNGNAQGEKHHGAKLTEEDVRFILDNIRSNGGPMTQRGLGRHFGVSNSTVYHIVKRNTWKHVSWEKKEEVEVANTVYCHCPKCRKRVHNYIKEGTKKKLTIHCRDCKIKFQVDIEDFT